MHEAGTAGRIGPGAVAMTVEGAGAGLGKALSPISSDLRKLKLRDDEKEARRLRRLRYLRLPTQPCPYMPA